MNLKKSRITVLIISIFLFLFSSQTTAQEKQITIQKDNISLKNAFAEIERQTNYSIAYKKSDTDEKQKINLSLKDVSLEKALEKILKDTELTYKINGYHIILVPKKVKSETKKLILTQSIRGIVYDVETERPVEFANVFLLNNPSIGTISDSLGHFLIQGVPLGYTHIKVSFVGYESYIYREILLTSARDAFVEIPLKESCQSIDEVVVRPQINKERAVNPMALSEGRMLSVEEANRFAGAFNDPARLVSSFAGVTGTGGISSNALSIRGNAPQYTQWRLEGVEIPNPTHFADMISLGGGVYSALSSQVMGNSDFFNGAFPAEYSNALSGIFDMQMRNGNNQKHQNTIQLSLIGIDLASEGPLSKKHNSSYIFNYRYSVTGLVADANLKYQDLSFKLNLPTKKAGTFSIWGLGLTDNNNVGPLDKKDWETYADRQDVKTSLEKASGGITHKYNINNKTYIKTVLAGTYNGIIQDVGQLDTLASYTQVVDISNKNWDIVLKSYINKKFSVKHVNRTGITVTGMIYDLDYNVTPNYGLDMPMENVAKGTGNNFQVSAFSQSIFTISSKLSLSAGLNAQYFELNSDFNLEPRLSMKWNFNPKQSLSLAYGLNSRRERLDFYYVTDTTTNLPGNKHLDLAKAHLVNLAYDWHISDVLHMKVEPYFQYLFDVPVESNTSFSVLNIEDYYLDKILINSGKGRNYGIDLTFEHYLEKGSYYLFSGSVFKSEYMSDDKIWRNTRFDRGYSLNGIWGKEWLVGQNKNNMFGLNIKLIYQGGERYTPIDKELSETSHEIILDDSKIFGKKYDPFINGDLTVSYRINRKKVSHEIALKGLNIGLYTGQSGYYYNEATKAIVKGNVMGALWDLCYKIRF
ncbi:MAG: prevent-host-death protein [Bacteroidales bacterium]|nr:prevent-host-death protein [Bacteroidales bacterium]